MYAEEDQRRLYESRHDIDAAKTPANLTGNAKMQAALVVSTGELSAARTALESAASSVERERNETDAERAHVDQSIAALVRRYGFIRGKVQDVLLNVDPEVIVSAEEIERRNKLFDRVFRHAPSDLNREGQGTIVEFVSGVATALQDEPDLKSLGFAVSLTTALDAAKAAQKALGRETNEDAQAMTALRNARTTLDTAALAHELLVESILVRVNRRDDLGQYILRRNAAYAARRAARVPVNQEPAAPEVKAPET